MTHLFFISFCRQVCLSRDGKTIFHGSDNIIKVWSIAKGTQLKTLSATDRYETHYLYVCNGPRIEHVAPSQRLSCRRMERHLLRTVKMEARHNGPRLS